jgi:hypothetical protein
MHMQEVPVMHVQDVREMHVQDVPVSKIVVLLP